MPTSRLCIAPWIVASVVLTACSSPTASTPAAGGPGSAPAPVQSATWTELPDGPLSARRDAAAAWLGDGFVVVGGWADQPCPPADDCVTTVPAERDGARLDPDTGLWQPIIPAPVPVHGTNAVVVNGELFLLTVDIFDGGTTPRPDGSGRPSFLRYTPQTDAWSTLPPPPDPSARLVAAGNRVLAIHQTNEHDAIPDSSVDAVFDGESWSSLPADPLGPSFDREAIWLGGEVLLTARDLVPNPGADEPALVRLATLDSTLTRWTLLPDSDIIGGGVIGVAGRALFPTFGSADGGSAALWEHPAQFGGIFNPADQGWTDLPAPPGVSPGIPAHALDVLDGRAWAVGDLAFIDGALLDPVTGQWTLLPGLPATANDGAVIATGTDSILVWGGISFDDDPAGSNVDTGYLLRL